MAPGRAGPLAISLRDLSAEASTIQLEELPLASPHQNDPRQLHYLEGKFTPSGRFGNDSHELENATPVEIGPVNQGKSP